jgi:dihydrolipoamide dehydrogenase
MKTEATTLLVIGGGPGGYVAAIRAGQLGIPTVLVEGDRLGGTCLNVGCIPSKALIYAADEFERARGHAADSPLGIRAGPPTLDLPTLVGWKDGVVARLTKGVAALLAKASVRVVKGRARIVDGKTVEVAAADGESLRFGCTHLLLATGSHPVALPGLPFGDAVVSSTEALSPSTLPRRLAVVGAGYIGLELGTVYRKLGCEVAIVESLSRVLPAYDAELTRPVAASLRRLGVDLHLECAVEGWHADAGALRVKRGDGTAFDLPADRVLVAVGRRPATSGYGLESLRLDMAGPAVRIDAECRTSMRDVWAIGDLTGEPMLAHRAMAQGEMVAEIIGGARRRFAPAAIPAVCYTDPEVVVAGESPDEAAARYGEITSAQFPLAANGRALTLESADGFVRVVARRSDHRIVGWQAVGRGVAELAAAFGQSLEMGAVLEDVAHTIHAHPTLGEAVQEAALRALGRALHA